MFQQDTRTGRFLMRSICVWLSMLIVLGTGPGMEFFMSVAYADDCIPAPSDMGHTPGMNRRDGSTSPEPSGISTVVPVGGRTVVSFYATPDPGNTCIPATSHLGEPIDIGNLGTPPPGSVPVPRDRNGPPAPGLGGEVIPVPDDPQKPVPPDPETPVKNSTIVTNSDKATGTAGKTDDGTDTSSGGDPIRLSCGELELSETDIVIRNLVVSRLYRNQACFESRMGYNWFPSYYSRILIRHHLPYPEGNFVVTHIDDQGRINHYTLDPNTGGYIASPGNFNFLVVVPSEHGGGWTIRTKHGKEYLYDANGLLTAIRVKGRTLHFDYLRDSNNALVKTPIKKSVTVQGDSGPVQVLRVIARDYQLTRIRDFAGRYLDFSYDGNTGRISSITDYTGRTWQYQVDPFGNLLSVADPAGNATSYTYYSYYEADNTHLDRNLKTVTDPMGQLTLTVFYDKFDRVTSQIEGEGTWTYDYTDYDTIVTDPRGVVEIHDFTPPTPGARRLAAESRIIVKSMGLRSIDPAEYVHEIMHNVDMHVTSVKLPNGSVIKDTYDTWGNIVENRRKPSDGPDNDQTDIVTRFEYEYRYHQVKKVTNPRGHVTRYVFDYMEDEVRFQKDFDEDGNIANVDHNGDGRTDQDFGNIVKIVFPTVTVYDPGGSYMRGSCRLLRYNNLGALSESVSSQGMVSRYEYYGPYDFVDGTSLHGYPKRDVRDVGGFNQTTSYSWNARGDLIRATDPRGSWTEYTYDVLGRKIREKTCPVTYEDDQGNTATLNDGYERILHLDRNGNIVGEEIENDATSGWFRTWYKYDVLNRQVEVKNPWNGGFISKVCSYDGSGNKVEMTYPNGIKSRIVYDERNFPYSVTSAADGPDASTTYYQYNATGRPVKITDGEGRETLMGYDAFDRLIKSTATDGTVTEYEYDKIGNVVHATVTGKTDLQGTRGVLLETWMSYDEAGKLVERREKIIDPLDPGKNRTIATRMAFDEMGNLVLVRDPRGLLRIYSYDLLGRLTSKTDAIGNQTSYAYDLSGNTVQETAIEITPEGGTRTTSIHVFYDERKRLYKTVDSLGNTTRMRSSSSGKVLRVVDALGHVTENTYNSFDSLVRTTRYLSLPGGGTDEVTTDYEYDENLMLTRIVDDNGNSTEYEYNDRGLVLLEKYGAGTADETKNQFFYDKEDNLVRKIDQAGHVTDYEYDSMYRLLRVEYHDGLVETFDYDGVGRMLRVWNNKGSTVTRVFDTLGRLREENQDGKVIESVYDDNSKRVQLVYPDGTSLALTRDDVNRIAAIGMNGHAVVRYRYLGPGLVAGREYPECGIHKTVAFDGNDQVVEHAHRTGSPAGAVIQGFHYGYDAAGNRTYKKYVHRGGAGERYVFDSLDRLVRVAYDCTDPSIDETGSASYTGYDLDGLGNRVQVDENGSTTAYQVNNPHNEYDAVGGVSRAHDPKGNLTDDGALVFTFNTKNELTEVRSKSDNSLVARFSYDGLGRRVGKETPSETFTYFYDGLSVILEYRTPAGGAEALHARYVLGNGIDEVLLVERDLGQGFVRHYYLEDALGSIAGIVDSSGSTVERYEYDVYGTLRVSKDGPGNDIRDAQGDLSTNVGNPYFFAGRRVDRETGLYYLRARYYDPAVGRFISRDPSGYVDGMNLYEYAKSNPVNYIDPMGNQSASSNRAVMANFRNAAAEITRSVDFTKWGMRSLLDALHDEVGRIDGALRGIEQFQKKAQEAAEEKRYEEAKYWLKWLQGAVEAFETGVTNFMSNMEKLSQPENMKGSVKLMALIEGLKNASFTDIATMCLDVIGMLNIPIISDIADISSSLIGVLTGDLTLAEGLGYSALTLIPGIGVGLAKVGARAAKLGKKPHTFQKLAKIESELRTGGVKNVLKGKAPKNVGRSGKQARLRQLADDPLVSSADRGWIKQEINQIERGKRKNIRLPGSAKGKGGGKVLAHRRGKEARKGFGYEYSDLQDVDLHKLQHKHEGY